MEGKIEKSGLLRCSQVEPERPICLEGVSNREKIRPRSVVFWFCYGTGGANRSMDGGFSVKEGFLIKGLHGALRSAPPSDTRNTPLCAPGPVRPSFAAMAFNWAGRASRLCYHQPRAAITTTFCIIKGPHGTLRSATRHPEHAPVRARACAPIFRCRGLQLGRPCASRLCYHQPRAAITTTPPLRPPPLPARLVHRAITSLSSCAPRYSLLSAYAEGTSAL